MINFSIHSHFPPLKNESVHGILRQNTGIQPLLLQRIFLALNCRQILYCLIHQGKPQIMNDDLAGLVSSSCTGIFCRFSCPMWYLTCSITICYRILLYTMYLFLQKTIIIIHMCPTFTLFTTFITLSFNRILVLSNTICVMWTSASNSWEWCRYSFFLSSF